MVTPYRLSSAVVVLGVLAALTSSSCPGLGTEPARSAVELPDNPTWSNGIGALLEIYCGECHGARSADESLAYFRIDIYYDDGSVLGAYSQRMRHLSRLTDPARPMPPPPRPGLTPDEIAGFRRWIENGAPFEDESGDGAGAFPPSRCEPASVGACACRGGYYGTQLCLDDGTYGECDCSTGGGPVEEGSLAELASQVLQPGCALRSCHVAGGIFPNLDDTSGLRARLLAPSRQEPGMNLVEPGSPESSYLYLKTGSDFASLGVGSGDSMPPPLAPGIAPWQRQMLESWIRAGALE